jgi:ABC-type polysaccharide/polyol phosphate transport system ATPase subunit
MAAIRVEGLGKRYRVNRAERPADYKTLRESLMGLATAPLRWWRGAEGRTEEFWALRDVTFAVEPGAVVGVIGRNGAGKSTLLKVLSRITRPTAGRVRLRGRVGSLLEVGTGFHPELSGRENVFLNGVILGMSRAEVARKLDDIVAFAELERFLDTPVKRYSSGMYVRLAFSVAAHLHPEILLVDEVLAVGDVSFQKKCLGQMGAVARGGRTVLFVSHQLEALSSLCPTSLLLEEGRLTAHADTRVRQNCTAIDDPVTLAVALNKTLVNRLLADAGLPVPRGVAFTLRELGQAVAFLEAAPGPCVVKPASGTGGGEGVTTGIRTRRQLAWAATLAAQSSSEMLLEEQVDGHNYRLLYLDGELLDAVQRRPPSVTGDGRPTEAGGASPPRWGRID